MNKKKYFLKAIIIALVVFGVRSGFSQTTYNVTSTNLDGPGSFLEAVSNANSNPGVDTIVFSPGLTVNASGANAIGEFELYVIAHITESVIIQGNGSVIKGTQNWVNTEGIQNFSKCPASDTSIITLQSMPGFVSIGTFDQDNSGLSVEINDLSIIQFNQIAKVNKNSNLILDNFEAIETWSTYQCDGENMIAVAQGANLTIKDSKFKGSMIWNQNNFTSFILGFSAGDLLIENSFFSSLNLRDQFAVSWSGTSSSRLNIVSSRFVGAGGVYLGNSLDQANFINSLWVNDRLGAPNFGDRFVNNSDGNLNFKASTLIWSSPDCDGLCLASNYGSLIRRSGSGTINFEQSAVHFNFDSTDPNVIPTLFDDSVSGFTADEYTFIRSTNAQSSNSLETITNQPNLLTTLPAFATSLVLSDEVDFDLILATPIFPSDIIDAIPSTEPLFHPITMNPISLDILGNPRADANGDRDIGAIQLGLAPVLSLANNGNGKVDLTWNEPIHHNGLSILRYELEYSPSTGGSTTTIDINPTVLNATVNGLTNGTEYDFKVRAIYNGPESGPYSNVINTKTFGSIETPTVKAEPGDSQVDIIWSLTDLGGREFNAYTILWRLEGSTEFIGGQAIYDVNQNSTTITGLTNDNTYEFAVAVIGSGEASNQGYISVTPSKSLSNLVYPNPVDNILRIQLSSQHIRIQLFSVLGQLLGEYNDKKTIDVSNLSTGMYLAIIYSENNRYIVKIMKK